MQKRLIKRNAFSSTNKSGVYFNAGKIIKSHRFLFLNLICLVYSTKFLLQMNFILMLSLNCLLFRENFFWNWNFILNFLRGLKMRDFVSDANENTRLVRNRRELKQRFIDFQRWRIGALSLSLISLHPERFLSIV